MSVFKVNEVGFLGRVGGGNCGNKFGGGGKKIDWTFL